MDRCSPKDIEHSSLDLLERDQHCEYGSVEKILSRPISGRGRKRSHAATTSAKRSRQNKRVTNGGDCSPGSTIEGIGKSESDRRNDRRSDEEKRPVNSYALRLPLTYDVSQTLLLPLLGAPSAGILVPFPNLNRAEINFFDRSLHLTLAFGGPPGSPLDNAGHFRRAFFSRASLSAVLFFAAASDAFFARALRCSGVIMRAAVLPPCEPI